jgi:hypothetical protein
MFDKSQHVYVDESFKGKIFVYSLTGQLLNTFEIDQSSSYFVSPDQVGIYMLHFVTQEYSIGYKIHVR